MFAHEFGDRNPIHEKHAPFPKDPRLEADLICLYRLQVEMR